MKIKSNVLFGLIVVIFLVSGFSLLKRLTQDVDEWRPSDLYSTTNVSRRSTYSVVSSGASASYSGAVPSVSSGASSMFRHRGVSSCAPALSVSNSQLPMAKGCIQPLAPSSVLLVVAVMWVVCLCRAVLSSHQVLLWLQLLA